MIKIVIDSKKLFFIPSRILSFVNDSLFEYKFLLERLDHLLDREKCIKRYSHDFSQIYFRQFVFIREWFAVRPWIRSRTIESDFEGWFYKIQKYNCHFILFAFVCKRLVFWFKVVMKSFFWSKYQQMVNFVRELVVLEL